MLSPTHIKNDGTPSILLSEHSLATYVNRRKPGELT
jgi:hypothetical protein